MTERNDPAQLKMIYLARARADLPAGGFRARWIQHGAFCRGLPVWNHLCHYEQCNALAAAELDALGLPGPRRDYDGVGMVWFRSEEAMRDATSEPTIPLLLADELETFDGPVANTNLMARETRRFDRGGTRVKLIAFVQRADDVTDADFVRRWRDELGAAVADDPALVGAARKYVQNVTVRMEVGPMEAYDGVVELGFAGTDHLAATLGGDGLARVIGTQAPGLLDAARTIALIADETLLYTDILGTEDSAPSIASHPTHPAP